MDWIKKFQWGSPWRDMRVEELVARGLVAEQVHLTEVTINCEVDSDTDAYMVSLQCVVDIERPEDRRPIAIDFTDWPLEYVDAYSPVAEGVSLLPVDAQKPVVVLRLRSGERWPGAALNLTMRWYGDPARSDASALRFLILPDFLPPILGGDHVDRAPRGLPVVSQPRLAVAGGVPSPLSVAAVRGKSIISLESERPLQLALFDQSDTECLEGGRVVLVGSEVSAWPSSTRDAIAKAQLRYLDYLSDQYGVLYDGRVVIPFGLSSLGPAFVFGCVIRGKPPWYGIGEGLRPGGNPGALVRGLSGIWWGTGCRAYGPVGSYLCMAIGSALGLRYLAATDDTSQLGASAKVLMDRAGCDRFGASPKVEDLTAVWGAIALSLFQQLKHTAVRERLQAMTREYWGSVISDSALIGRLLEWGVKIPEPMIRAAT